MDVVDEHTQKHQPQHSSSPENTASIHSACIHKSKLCAPSSSSFQHFRRIRSSYMVSSNRRRRVVCSKRAHKHFNSIDTRRGGVFLGNPCRVSIVFVVVVGLVVFHCYRRISYSHRALAHIISVVLTIPASKRPDGTRKTNTANTRRQCGGNNRETYAISVNAQRTQYGAHTATTTTGPLA